jgi:hypothetical protein
MIFKTLLLSLSVALHVGQASEPPACPEIQISYNVSSTESSTSSIQFEIKGGSAPYSIIFFDSKGRLMSQDFTTNIFSQLTSGNYQCLVVDKNKCSNILNVIIP